MNKCSQSYGDNRSYDRHSKSLSGHYASENFRIGRTSEISRLTTLEQPVRQLLSVFVSHNFKTAFQLFRWQARAEMGLPSSDDAQREGHAESAV